MRAHFHHSIFFILIVFFSLIACYKLFTPSFYTSHDGEGHVIRMIEYDEAWRDGQMPVRIAKRINYGLGYPFFNFNYPLPYFFGQVIHLAGFSFVTSFKLLFILSTIIAGLSMYLFMRTHVSRASSFISALFYIFVPYRFLNMYVRGNPAEYLGLSLLPLLFFSIDRLVDTKGKKYGLFIFSGIVFFLSHNSTALIGFLIALCYFLIRLYHSSDQKRIGIYFVLSLAFIGCTTSFFWIPVVFETGLTKLSELSEDYQFFFPSFRELLYSPWGFGAYKQGDMPGKMSPQIGLLHISVYIVSIFGFLLALWNKKIIWKKARIFIFFFSIVTISMFFTLSVSKPLWDGIFLLRMVQLPWRFLGIIAFGSSVLVGCIVNAIHIHRSVFIFGYVIVIGMLLYVNRNHIRVNQYTEFQNPFDLHPIYGFSTTSKDEHMPRLAPRIHEDPNPDGDFFPLSAGISKRTVWKSNYQMFSVMADQPVEFRANVSYFPGWNAFLDSKPVLLLYNKDEYQRLRIKVPEGVHIIEFRFSEPWYRLIADSISLIALVSLLGVCIVKKGKNI